MRVPQRLPGDTVPDGPPARWNWLRIAQGVWILLALTMLGIFMANLSSYYQSSLAFCTQPDPSSCPTGQLSPSAAHLLAQFHLSVTVVAISFATLTIAVSGAYWVVGLLIVI